MRGRCYLRSRPVPGASPGKARRGGKAERWSGSSAPPGRPTAILQASLCPSASFRPDPRSSALCSLSFPSPLISSFPYRTLICPFPDASRVLTATESEPPQRRRRHFRSSRQAGSAGCCLHLDLRTAPSVIPISPVKTRKNREVKGAAEGHTACKRDP